MDGKSFHTRASTYDEQSGMEGEGDGWTCDAGGYYWPMYFTERLACIRRSNRDVICWLVADVLGSAVPVARALGQVEHFLPPRGTYFLGEEIYPTLLDGNRISLRSIHVALCDQVCFTFRLLCFPDQARFSVCSCSLMVDIQPAPSLEDE